MSDSKIQSQNRRNQFSISFLKYLYKKRSSLYEDLESYEHLKESKIKEVLIQSIHIELEVNFKYAKECRRRMSIC